MADIAQRFANNPIISPAQIVPSVAGFEVASAFNPGAFEYKGKIGLVLRVAERPEVKNGYVDSVSISIDGRTEVSSFQISDPDIKIIDTRLFSYKGVDHLTTLSHLRLAWSEDGENFEVEEKPMLIGASEYEALGIEDSRVTKIDDTYYLTYTAVSHNGYGVGMQSTKDWKTFEKFGVVIPPFNKDATLFPEKISDLYHMLHRPTGSGIGGPYIWSASSPDLHNWGNHKCIAQVRPGKWDSERIGAGSAPIKTEQGWLEIYHGAEKVSTGHRYCLGALLLDLKDPSKVIARSTEPIMEPISPYELEGFYGNVVFTNGQVIRGDEVLLYYGAADSYTCGARLSIKEILNSLKS
jgi:predicted GH43/DUF377 family glycosyl hydrolase